MSTPTAAAIRELPKLEMHIHLEGTISLPRIARLAEAAGETLPRPLDQLYVTNDLGEFLECLDWVCGLVRSGESAREVALDFARYCNDQGIVYAELIVNPTHWSGLGTVDLLTALNAAFDDAAAEGLADIRLLPSILRQQTAAEALELVDLIGEARLARVVGLSIDGNEAATGRTAARFAAAYTRARELGLGCTAHAGESSGAQGVLDALDILKVSRIDHGIRAIELDGLPQRLAEQGVTLNVCLSSNCALVYGSIDKHPIKALLAAGVPVTLNTDDPVVLKTDLISELEFASGHLGWDLERLAEAQRVAVRSAFCSDADKTRLLERIDTQLEAALA